MYSSVCSFVQHLIPVQWKPHFSSSSVPEESSPSLLWELNPVVLVNVRAPVVHPSPSLCDPSPSASPCFIDLLWVFIVFFKWVLSIMECLSCCRNRADKTLWLCHHLICPRTFPRCFCVLITNREAPLTCKSSRGNFRPSLSTVCFLDEVRILPCLRCFWWCSCEPWFQRNIFLTRCYLFTINYYLFCFI